MEWEEGGGEKQTLPVVGVYIWPGSCSPESPLFMPNKLAKIL